MPYDLKPLDAPRTAGLRLRALVALMEAAPRRSLPVKILLRKAGIEALRHADAGSSPGLFIPPLETPGGAPPRGADADGDWTGGEGIERFRQAYGSGELTPVEVAARFLEAVADTERRTPPLRAFIAVDEDDLFEQAKSSAARYRAGAPIGPLDGVPVAVKDELDQEGYPTTLGTCFLGASPATADATVVGRLRRAGAILVGKTNMHEIGLGVTGLNPHHGPVRNPHDPTRSPGGSSSGSAAAVAAGLCPVALGADGGGSARIPASFCGVVGFKPTFSRLSEEGVAPVCWSVAHVGILAATVKDCALCYGVTAGPDPMDPVSLRQPPVALPRLDAPRAEGVRIGVYTPWFEDAAPEVVSACRRALEALVAAGATVHEVEVPELALQRVIHLVTIVSEMATAHPPPGSEAGAYGLDTRLNLALARALESRDYLHAQRHRARLAGEWRRIFSEVDVMATPTTGRTAPEFAADALPKGESNLPLTVEIMRFAQPANLMGLPAISVPAPVEPGALPVGFQLMGRAWEEALVLKLAAVVEESAGEEPRPSVHHDLMKAG